MKDCDRFQEMLDRRLLGEASAPLAPGAMPAAETAAGGAPAGAAAAATAAATADDEALAAHCRSCPRCRALSAVELDLRDAGAAVQPDAGALAEVRRAVLRQLRHDAAADAWQAASRGGGLGFDRRRAAGIAAALAVLAAAAAIGFLAGRGTAGPPLPEPLQAAREIDRAALAGGGAGGDPLDSPFTYENVRIDSGAGDRLHLAFDLSAHLEIERPAGDPLVADVVAQALLAGRSPLGSRLKAAAVAARLPDPRVRRALLRALKEDPSLAVRLAALGSLARSRGDPAVAAAVTAALAGEPSIELRLLALDYLAGSGADRETLRRLAMSASGTMRTPLLVRAAHDLERH
jgi:hypothetical protein